MKQLNVGALVAVLCLAQGSGTPPLQGASAAAVVNNPETELQRNFKILSKEPTPAYFIGYTVHDERDLRMNASFGSLERSDESRGRFGTVEVRVGDYRLDNTHPIRGDA